MTSMTDDDPSVSPKYRYRQGDEINKFLAGLDDTGPNRVIQYNQGYVGPGIDIHTAESGGVHITGPESSAPWAGVEAYCPHTPGSMHVAATPPGSYDWSLLTYNFADGSGIRLRLCAQCSGIFWERTSA